MERIVLTANGNLQRILSAYYGSEPGIVEYFLRSTILKWLFHFCNCVFITQMPTNNRNSIMSKTRRFK